jgi:hypothetical protein
MSQGGDKNASSSAPTTPGPSIGTPESLKISPWSKFQEESYTFIDEDFPHEKFLTVKTNQKSASSAVKLSSTFNKKVEGMRIADDLKFWFNVKNEAKLFVRYK